MTRHRHREWNNAKKRELGNQRHPQGWNSRIIWFKPGNELEGIRLSLEDCERRINIYPESEEEAEHFMFQFRTGSPMAGDDTPFVRDLIKLLSKKYSHLENVKV